ncbi:ABC transporter substrate-binding protein [Mycobacterium sp. AZCC_0083]|uniref:ABC transporter substrate-binding protein n=1 Tax=Mycobacterium sp. AZCC_0083 TaxID=2735882 RepID=UPI00160C4B78|nr:ABC transporter substrate-binding protein [Mycobacterium sp. AZCC_0083]MBB5160225.1 peptide/nickel transport system substrate-binding protein [Mycobacterium sp. AZCC_0083]
MGALSRRSFITASAAVAGAAVSSAILSGCGNPTALPNSANEVRPGAAGTPSRGGILYFGLSTDPANFDPHVSTGAASDYLRQLAYNSLLQFDSNGEIIGDLAEEYGFTDPRTYVVRLRQGVTFHDGSPLTADDVVFSIRRMQDKATAASSAPLLADIVEVVARDPRTVEMRLAEPDVALPFALALPPTLIVSKRWIESGANPKTTVMGTGPFRLVERIPGVATTYERFDSYFEPDLPYLNGIVFQPMGDDYARVTALRAATVDMIDYVPATHVDVIQRNPQLQFASDKNFGFGYVGFDLAQKPFDDVRVRKAVAMSIDRDAVLDTAFLGHGVAMNGSLMPQDFAPYATKFAGAMPYDPDQARSLLRQAGVEGLRAPMVTTSSYSVIFRPAQAMLPSLRSSGLDIDLVPQEWLTFRASVTNKEFPVHAWGTAPKFGDPASLADFLGSTGVLAKTFSFSDPEIDRLLSEGKKTADPALRMEIYADIERRTLDLVPFTYTVRREQGEAFHTYVKGYAHPPKGAWTGTALRRTWLERSQ